MEILMALLMLVAPIGVLILLILVPVLIGVTAYDVIATKRREGKTAKDRSPEAARNRIFLERGFARGFVIVGGAFWAIAAFAGLYSFRDAGAMRAFIVAGVPLVATIVTLIVGWYWERVASVMLALASVAAVVYGVASGFEVGVWLLVTFTLIGPMLTAAALFWAARREFEALELRLAQPELAFDTIRASRF